MDNTNKSFARQGDILFYRVASLPASLAVKPLEMGKIILAHGEVTGHHHAIVADDRTAAFADPVSASNTYLDVKADTEVTHQEHGTIHLPKGQYLVVRQIEWTDADEPVNVAD